MDSGPQGRTLAETRARSAVDLPARAGLLARIGLFAVMAVALSVLIGGWVLGLERFLRLRLDFAAMAPSTSVVLFLFSGAALWRSYFPEDQRARLAKRIAAVFAAIVAVVDLGVIFTRVGTGVDALIWPGEPAFHTVSMAPATAFCTLMAAICAWSASRPGHPQWTRWAVIAGTLGLMLSLFALVSYAFDAAALYEVSLFTAMALHTAFAFSLLFISLLLIHPGDGWMAVLLAPDSGSAGARRLLPAVVLIAFVLGLITLAATDRGLFSANFRLSLMTILMIGLLTAAVIRNAAIENATGQRLRKTATDLARALDDRDLLLREVYHRVKNNLQQVNALLMIESNRLTDPKAKEPFMAMGDRIRALSGVHSLLLSSPRPSQLSVKDYLDSLGAGIAASNGAAQRNITIDVDADAHPVDVDFAIPLGLLVNELLSNCVKHAFRDQDSGAIEVRFKVPEEGPVILSVSDDGCGLPDGATGIPGSSAGGLIISGLVGQLGADMDMDGSDGLKVTITIPREKVEAHG